MVLWLFFNYDRFWLRFELDVKLIELGLENTNLRIQSIQLDNLRLFSILPLFQLFLPEILKIFIISFNYYLLGWLLIFYFLLLLLHLQPFQPSEVHLLGHPRHFPLFFLAYLLFIFFLYFLLQLDFQLLLSFNLLLSFLKFSLHSLEFFSLFLDNFQLFLSIYGLLLPL